MAPSLPHGPILVADPILIPRIPARPVLVVPPKTTQSADRCPPSDPAVPGEGIAAPSCLSLLPCQWGQRSLIHLCPESSVSADLLLVPCWNSVQVCPKELGQKEPWENSFPPPQHQHPAGQDGGDSPDLPGTSFWCEKFLVVQNSRSSHPPSCCPVFPCVPIPREPRGTGSWAMSQQIFRINPILPSPWARQGSPPSCLLPAL